jgi:hypothetical protein
MLDGNVRDALAFLFANNGNGSDALAFLFANNGNDSDALAFLFANNGNDSDALALLFAHNGQAGEALALLFAHNGQAGDALALFPPCQSPVLRPCVGSTFISGFLHSPPRGDGLSSGWLPVPAITSRRAVTSPGIAPCGRIIKRPRNPGP